MSRRIPDSSRLSIPGTGPGSSSSLPTHLGVSVDGGGSDPRRPGAGRRWARWLSGFLLLVSIWSAGTPADLGAAAPDDARVRGQVVSGETGAPLPGVTVRVANASIRAETDRFGSFFLGGLEAGPVELHFTRLGFQDEVRNLELREGGDLEIRVALETAPLALNPVLVLMDRTRMVGDPLNLNVVPGSAHFLSGQDLQALKLPFDNVHDALRQIPGVNVQDEEGYGLRPNVGLRGAGAERSSNVTVMEDGVLAAPAPYAAPAAYYFPILGRMEAVEVRKGASQIRYGPRTMGGALNLVSQSIPEDFDWRLEMGGGSEGMFKGQGSVGGGGDHTGWMLQSYQIRTDGFKELQGGGDTGFRVSDYLGKFRVNTARDARLYQEAELKVGFHDHRSNETYLGLTEPDFRLTPNLRYAASRPDVMEVEQRQLRLRHFLRAGDRFDVVTDVYHNQMTREWYKLQSVLGQGISGVLNDPDANPESLGILRGADSDADALKVRANNRRYFSRGVQTTAGFHLPVGGLDQKIEVGVRYHEDQEDRLQFEDGYRMSDGNMIVTTHGAPGSQDNRTGDASAWALFVQNQLAFGPLTVTPGLRVETIDFTRTDYERADSLRTGQTTVRTNSVSAVVPGVGMTYALSPRTHLFGGVHRGFGPPGPGADPDTRIEESVNYEVGARLRRARIGAQVAGFFSDYSNILGRATLATGETGTGELFNGGAVETMGLELSADYDPTLGRGLSFRLPVRLAYTWTRASFQSSFESAFDPWGTVTRGDRLPYLPEHLVSAQLSLNRGPWDVTLGANGASAMRTEAGTGPIPTGQGADAFVVLNLSGEYRLQGGGGSIFAAIQNVGNESYVVSRRPAGARPGLPRTFHAGVRVRR